MVYKPVRENGSRVINILGAGPGGSKLTTRTKPGQLIEDVIRAKLAECSNNASPGAAHPLSMGDEDCPDAADDVPATSPHFSPRRSKRARTDTLANKFSPSAGWSNYEKNRVGARHDRTRVVTYQQAIVLMRELRGFLSRIVNLDGTENYMPHVIEALQLALVDIVDEEDASDRTPDSAPMAPRRESGAASTTAQPRVQDGQDLRLTLKEIIALEKAGKLDEARGLAASALAPVPEDDLAAKQLSVRRGELAKTRAKEMRDHFFSLGGWELTSDVLKRFLNTPEVRRLMPGAATKPRAEEADAKFSSELLAAAKRLFTDILGRDKGGRRREEDMNIFWAAVAALMPKDLLANRGGRAASRILGVHHRVVKSGVGIRANLDEHGNGWIHIKYSGHADAVEWRIVTDWWHTDHASCEDNQNKQPICVYQHKPLGKGASSQRAAAGITDAADSATAAPCLQLPRQPARITKGMTRRARHAQARPTPRPTNSRQSTVNSNQYTGNALAALPLT